MAGLLTVLIILGCTAYLYLKGTLVKSFAMLITTICAAAVAFGYFEQLANVLIRRDSLTTWSQPLSFILLFVLAFVILQIITALLTRQPVELGPLTERIGRVVCAILSGLIISGILLTALAMAPLSNKSPYQRFDPARPDPERPNKSLLNADGLATSWFSLISKGGLGGKRSFAALHPDFLDQLFLNRQKISDGISIYTTSQAIEIPRKQAAWPAPEDIKDATGKTVPQKTGHNLTIVRIGIKKNAINDAGKFTPSQVRLLCKQKSDAKKPLAGKAKNVYPVGYLKTANQLQKKQLNDSIEIEHNDFDDSVKWIDFAFYVPNDFTPVLAQFKQNNVAAVPPPVTAKQAPPPIPFIPLAECAMDIAQLHPISSARVHGLELATGTKFLTGLTLQIKDPNQFQNAQTPRSIKPAQFDNEQFNYARAELKREKPPEEIPKPAEEEKPKAAEPTPKRPQQKRVFAPTRIRRTGRPTRKSEGITGMIKPLDGYTLLSLKCNNPSTGTAIKGEHLPVLIDLTGAVHHPVGVIASGKVGEEYLCEFDYCAIIAEDNSSGLVIAEDGSVARPFPDTVWLTDNAQNTFEFYVLYLVEAGRNTIIMSVQPPDPHTDAGFKQYEGFLAK